MAAINERLLVDQSTWGLTGAPLRQQLVAKRQDLRRRFETQERKAARAREAAQRAEEAPRLIAAQRPRCRGPLRVQIE